MTRAAPFGFGKVVFLSHVIADSTPVFPGDPPVEVRPAATIERDGYYLQLLAAGEQAGTHWAAPAHFHAGQATADELDPGDFFFPAVVLDVRAAAAENPDFALGVEEIRQWEAAYGLIPPDSAVVMRTGFEDRWDDPAAYLNADLAGTLHYPGFGAMATSWLIEHRSIGALGIDTMGIDPGADTEFRSNQLLLQGHRLHLENLSGLSEMPPAGGWIIVGGIRIRAGSGSPATVFGLIPLAAPMQEWPFVATARHDRLVMPLLSPLPSEAGSSLTWRHPAPEGKWAVRPTPGGLDGPGGPCCQGSSRTYGRSTAPPPKGESRCSRCD